MKLAVIDFETDPFKHGRAPLPFAAGFYDGENYMDFWGDECTLQLMRMIGKLEEPHIIYAHNGGKFDFFFLLPWIENPLRIINGRIVEAKIGIHTLRDSFAILPIPLSAYKKDDIDYAHFEREVREKYRSDILHYLASDCEYLFDLVAAFRDRFGDKMTIGSTALGKLREFHPFRFGNPDHDAEFRPFYFGGRCEFFERGILKSEWNIFDVNSMYPHAMRDYDHPTGTFYANAKNPKITKDGLLRGFSSHIYFARIDATSLGALPVRTKQGLTFPHGRFVFDACSHEIIAAIECGLLQVHSVEYAKVPLKSIRFVEYVDTYSAEKIDAKKCGDKPREIFSKLLLNSAYGKTASNPDNYFDYSIGGVGEKMRPPWEFYGASDAVWIWRKPIDDEDKSFVDVAIGASITSASRSILLRAIHKAKRPIYCDTDSIICEDLRGVRMSETELGAWKFEGSGDSAAIAAKKLYAIFNGKECIKSASKGVRLSPQEIVRAAKGEIITWENDAPSFSLTGAIGFTKRAIDIYRGKR